MVADRVTDRIIGIGNDKNVFFFWMNLVYPPVLYQVEKENANWLS